MYDGLPMTSTDASSAEYESTDNGEAYSAEITLLEKLRLLNAAGGALLTQATLHSELLRIEWAEEKQRLLTMLLVLLLGFGTLFCMLLFAGVLVLALNWDTGYRISAIIALMAIYAGATFFAWRRFQALSAQSEQMFAASREELAADLALLRQKLCL